MRVSTSMVFDLGVAGMQRQQSALMESQQQLSSGRRILTPADDPIASAQSLQLTQSDDINTQYGVNRDAAEAQLELTESALTDVTNLLQNIREKAVNAGDGSYTNNDLDSLAIDLAGMLEQLIGAANGTDAEGQYLFAGFQSNVLPFVRTPGGVQFVGDDGQRLLQVAASRQLPFNLSGAEVFERIREGNGTFTWDATATNTGTAVIGPGSVNDPALLTGDDYQIAFTVTTLAGVTTTTYDVIDTTTATTILTAQPYTAGAATISFDGVSVNLMGDPANGDTFTITPSRDRSVFTIVQDLITQLQNGRSGAAGKALYDTDLGLSLTNLDQAMENLLTHRAELGSNLREIDALNDAGEALGLQYQSTRSNLTDLDYAKAASDLAREQAALEAAQKSFIRISGLSLFDYL